MQTIIRLFLILICMTCANIKTYAETNNARFNMQDFQELPILHDGRIKPLDSFAKLTLKQLHGYETYRDMNATTWLATVIFTPEQAVTYSLFRINSPLLKDRLHITDKTKKYFSLIDLGQGLIETQGDISALLKKPKNNLEPHEAELISIHENTLLYNKTLQSISLILPIDHELPDILKERLNIRNNQKTLLIDIKNQEQILNEAAKNILAKTINPDDFTEEETKIVSLFAALQFINQNAVRQNQFKILPSQWDGINNEWVSPWEAFLKGQGSPQTVKLLNHWSQLAQAYRTENPDEWNASITAIKDHLANNNSAQIDSSRLSLEVIYNTIKPLFIAEILYAIAALAGILFVATSYSPLFYTLATLLTSAAIVHSAAIISRIIILDRPPVGSLYESIIFVSIAAGITGVYALLRRKDISIVLTTGCLAFILLIIAPVFAPKGDNLENLVAVLNTNFWLTTHVICITLGYAVCIIAGSLSHVYLFNSAFKNNEKENSQRLHQNIYSLSITALCVVTCGTFLGGVWADQSWGRFWGWDPKENGALLIMLWIVWVQHARLGRHVSRTVYHAGIAYLNVIVAISWFGVNLLNTGLHSYGFTQGAQIGFILFCFFETIVIAGLYIKAKGREIPNERNA